MAIKGTPEKWLELTEKSLKKEEYGEVETCEFCLFVGFKNETACCNHCIFYKLYKDDWHSPCDHYFDVYTDVEISIFIWETMNVRTGLTELKIALESLIKGY